MCAFDKIIGYSDVKHELLQISDILKNTEAYNKLGVRAPRGLMLYGEPGVGKTTMALAIIEESGRSAFTLRKDTPNGDFVKKIKETFDEAIENAPSIVFLDDMDKFSNGDERHPDAEEYVTVQSCMDSTRGKEVFVMATINNYCNLPKSLCRAGRFDRSIEIEAPYGKDAEEIIAHYLYSKKFVEGFDAKTIAKILDGSSCAQLEVVINEAGLCAGYERCEYITEEHFMKACLRTVFNVTTNIESKNKEDCRAILVDAGNRYSHIVYHEAGHTVVSEVLRPESVTLACAYAQNNGDGGFVAYYQDKTQTPLNWKKTRIAGSLGGMAAIEMMFGVCDAGNVRDLDSAFESMRELVVNNCICGLRLHKNEYEDSQRLWSDQEETVSKEVERYYKKALEILIRNREFFEKVAMALAQKGYLTMGDIRSIKSTCTIVPFRLD